MAQIPKIKTRQPMYGEHHSTAEHPHSPRLPMWASVFIVGEEVKQIIHEYIG